MKDTTQTTKKSTLRSLMLCALFAALTAILAQIMIPIGPVMFNLAVFGAFLAGMMLPVSWAAASMGVYMGMGLVGVPVFAGFAGGPAILFGKTGGYVIGYVCIAICTALAVSLAKKCGKRPAGQACIVALGMSIGLVLCYALGTAWFMVVTGSGFAAALGWCVVPFILPDIAKGVSAYALGRLLSDRLSRAGLA